MLVGLAVALSAVALTRAHEEDSVLALTPETFKSVVGGDKPAFAMFYAPWCGHCKSLAPDWAVLADTFAKSPVSIVKVDADAHKELGSEYGVSGYPTLKYFPAGSLKADDYTGGRSLDDLIAFVNGKIGTNKKAKKAPSAVIDLDDSNVDAVLGDASKAKLLELYAPW